MKLIDIIILGIVLVAAGLAILSLYRNRGKGCGGSCGGCAKSESCHSWASDYKRDRDGEE